MTALVSLRKAESIGLLTDAAAYTADGIIAGIGSKIIPLPEIRGVITARGVFQVARMFALEAQTFRSFDDLIEGFPDVMQKLEADGVPVIAERFYLHELVIAGWSESIDRPVLFFCGLHGRSEEADGRLYYIGPRVWALGVPVPPLQAMIDNPDPETLDLATDGIAVMEAMRQVRAPFDESASHTGTGHCVGGFLEQTTITATGIEQRIVHRWPDEVGRRIEPVQ